MGLGVGGFGFSCPMRFSGVGWAISANGWAFANPERRRSGCVFSLATAVTEPGFGEGSKATVAANAVLAEVARGVPPSPYE